MCKQALKVVGLSLDRGKIGTCSMFFVAEFMGTMFYFTFYRMLFEEFVGWGVFWFVQFTHFGLEWLMYVGRGTLFFFSLMNMIPCEGLRGLLMMQGLVFRDWQVFLALDFSLRTAIVVFTAPVCICECYRG